MGGASRPLAAAAVAAAAAAAAASASSSSPLPTCFGFAFSSGPPRKTAGRPSQRQSQRWRRNKGPRDVPAIGAASLSEGDRDRDVVRGGGSLDEGFVEGGDVVLGGEGGGGGGFGVLEEGFRREGGEESVLDSSTGSAAARIIDGGIGGAMDLRSIVDDGHGHINAELARSLWEWENDHLLNMTDDGNKDAKDTDSKKKDRFPAAGIKFSTRAGLRIVDEIARDLLALHSDPDANASPPSSPTAAASTAAAAPAAATASGASYADLIQEGVVALMKTLSTFDPEAAGPDGEDFQSQCRREVYRSMAKAVADADSRAPLRLPGHVHEALRRARSAESALRSELGREPTDSEVAARAHVPPDKLRFYRLAARTAVPVESTVEIYDPTSEAASDDGDGPATFADEDMYETLTGKDEALLHSGEDELLEEEEEWVEPHDKVVAPLRDFIADTSDISPDDLALHDMMRGDVDDLLRRTLDERELRIVRLKFGLDGTNGGRGMSYADIGKELGLSRQRAAQIELRALEKLRASYSSAFVELYLDDDHSEEVSV